MSSMFGGKAVQGEQPEQTVPVSHDKCDESQCVQVPSATCTSCHRMGLSHSVTLDTDTDHAADQTEDLLS